VNQTKRLASIQCFLLDLDGTVNIGEVLARGALDFFDVLRQQGKRFLFLTNNSTKTKKDYVEKFTRLGVPLAQEQVLTSGDALIHVLGMMKPGARILPLATPSFEAELEKAGFTLVREPGPGIDFVCVAFDDTLTYAKLEAASRCICAGVPYLATSCDLRCPVENGAFLPDCGAITGCLEAGTGNKPLLFAGKPSVLMLEMAEQITGIPRKQMAVVGDRLYTDIKTATDNGATGILVLTGEATREDAAKGPTRPHLIFNDIGELADALKALPAK
jgi:4-nitrophenyl phosphatase